MITTIRRILAEHGKLLVDVSALDDDAGLYQVGLTSHDTVNVMLALEDAYDVEFPDELLRKSTFDSVRSISEALASLGISS
jgi:acyl carrier protein